MNGMLHGVIWYADLHRASRQDRAKEPNVAEAADQGRFSCTKGSPVCMGMKTQGFLKDSVNRMLGH